MVKTIVVKLGGSFLLASGQTDVESMKSMAEAIKTLRDEGYRVIVVVGGGVPARQYIAAAAAFNASNGVKDYLGILVSRLNARVFIEALGDLAYPNPPESFLELRAFLESGKVVVLGGMQPGQSTTAVAALAAEYVKAEKVIFCTNVEYVYTDDPRKNPEAKKLERVTYKDLVFLTSADNCAPGQYQIIDALALLVLERSKLTGVIMEGTKDKILAAARGEPIGTVVGPLP
eukprot:TRINITY_DN13336_c0_g1_i1.p1 TRINITY_DN13336_c0_g1~~TRINITY_DN13336_c0_g1_i1.p1  ORF type:complete len:231 (+),score=40.09 TRINITY_DN13336_c0_g1_i1:61-753(+)